MQDSANTPIENTQENPNDLFKMLIMGIIFLLVDQGLKILSVIFSVLEYTIDYTLNHFVDDFIFYVIKITLILFGSIIIFFSLTRLKSIIFINNNKPFTISIILLAISSIFRLILLFIENYQPINHIIEEIITPIFNIISTILLALFFAYGYYNQYLLNKQSKIRIGFALLIIYFVVFIIAVVIDVFYIKYPDSSLFYFINTGINLVLPTLCICNFIYLLLIFKIYIYPLIKSKMIGDYEN